QQKKRFFHGLIGVAIVLLADVTVDYFRPGARSIGLAGEIGGIVEFLLTIIGALAVLGFIVAGFMLVVSTDESLKDRAKKAIFATVVTMIIVLASSLIVRFVIGL